MLVPCIPFKLVPYMKFKLVVGVTEYYKVNKKDFNYFMSRLKEKQIFAVSHLVGVVHKWWFMICKLFL